MTLWYNHLGKRYIFFEGKKDGPQRNRVEWVTEEVVSQIKKTIDLKRKSVLYLIDVNREVYGKIKKVFDGSKVTLNLENRLQTN